ncbi:MAG: helix-turn-helix domain-containing protein, partial [Planctomycetes bacterium]|nr:helix-turn-helix domain-containing protein [Planctomycetota bacterium]
AKWRGRYLAGGLPALRDAPRSGRPRRIRQRERVEVVSVACRLPKRFGLQRTLWRLWGARKVLPFRAA